MQIDNLGNSSSLIVHFRVACDDNWTNDFLDICPCPAIERYVIWIKSIIYFVKLIPSGRYLLKRWKFCSGNALTAIICTITSAVDLIEYCIFSIVFH